MNFLELENTPNKLNLIGTDEVGRGPIAGPVIACAVGYSGTKEELHSCLEYLFKLNVTDSKKLTQDKRNLILKELLGNKVFNHSDYGYLKEYYFNSTLPGFSFCIQAKSPDEIAGINILWASMEAMSDCVSIITKSEECIIWVDGNRLPKILPKHSRARSIIKGDEKSLIIGLASVIAKQFRDQLMCDYHDLFPEFNFNNNAGYPTPAHKLALSTFGRTPIHRVSFKPVKEEKKIYGER